VRVPTLLNLAAGDAALDPRARRVALAAKARGWDVVPVGLAGVSRSPRAVPAQLRELRGVVRLVRLVRTTVLLVTRARHVSSEVVHAHDLDALPAGWILARRRQARLVYDAHELYTGFDGDPPRIWLWVVWRLEGVLARRAAAVVTVSEEIADELARRHHLSSPPFVVLNCPPLQEVRGHDHSGPLRAIYQAAAAPGRKLADLGDAVRDGIEVSARVLGGGELPAGVRRLDPVGPGELVQALADHEVGLVIDRIDSENARLALPNKLFEYLMAGLAVLAPRSAAMAALLEGERVGGTYEPGGLGDALASLARDRPRLADMRRRARAAAVERYNAEAQRPALYAAWGL
jgi:glycogen(starch) synthase